MENNSRKIERYSIIKSAFLKSSQDSIPIIIKEMNATTIKLNTDAEISFESKLFLSISSDIKIPLKLKRIKPVANGSIDYVFDFFDLQPESKIFLDKLLQSAEPARDNDLRKIKTPKINKRNDLRVPLICKIQINDIDKEGTLINLTKKGLFITTNEYLELQKQYNITINLENKKDINISVILTWQKQKEDNLIMYGGLIKEPEEKIQNKINRIIELSENLYLRIPQFKNKSYEEAIKARCQWLAERQNIEFKHINRYTIPPDEVKSNIENMIGASQMPLAIAGPIKVNGEHAQGLYYVPFATTEGTLVATYEMGMLAITKAGGANVVVVKSGLDITPIFKLRDVFEAKKFAEWVHKNFEYIKYQAETTTKHGKLLKITPYLLAKDVMLNFLFDTGDAMGMNMVNIATSKACEYIIKDSQFDIDTFYLRSNLSSDKKASYFNYINSYGKEVHAEVTLPRDIVIKYLGTTPEKFIDLTQAGMKGSIQAGMIGNNAHFANGLAAMYLALGQDVAQVVNASCGIFDSNLTKNGDLYCFVKLPSLILGTVGGGTKLATHKECLNIIDCYGEGKAEKLAEIIAVTTLAGDITIRSALSSNSFIKAHIKTKNKGVI